MRRLALALPFVLAACGPSTSAPPSRSDAAMSPASPADALTLFDFAADGPAWSIENDGVMGGDSQGFHTIADGTLRFTGEVVTEGGGFTSVRAERAVDLRAYDAVELRVRGGGRTFEIDLYDGVTDRGREVSRRGAFPTAEAWQTVRVPFGAIETTVHGEPSDAPPFDPAAVQSVGLYIIDGQDGPFRLEVDWIRAVRSGA